MNNGELIQIVATYDEVMAHWPMFLQGLDELNATTKRKKVPAGSFLRVLLDIGASKLNGVNMLLTSKNGKPLAYIVAFDNTSDYGEDKTLWVYCIYSNRKLVGAARMLFVELEKWAKERGYTEIQAQSGRTSGASIRWCKSTFGLQLSELFFSKSI